MPTVNQIHNLHNEKTIPSDSLDSKRSSKTDLTQENQPEGSSTTATRNLRSENKLHSKQKRNHKLTNKQIYINHNSAERLRTRLQHMETQYSTLMNQL